MRQPIIVSNILNYTYSCQAQEQHLQLYLRRIPVRMGLPGTVHTDGV